MTAPTIPEHLLSRFPPRQDHVQGFFVPIWCEPMIGSGERICCAIVAVSAADVFIVQTPGFARFAAAYGPGMDTFLLECAKATSEYLVEQLRNPALRAFICEQKRLPTSTDDTPQVGWVIEGFTLGEPTFTTGATLKQIAVTGLMMRASFCTQEELDVLRKD